MSEKESPLIALGNKIRAGMAKINEDAKSKAERRPAGDDHDDNLDIHDESNGPGKTGGDEGLSAHKAESDDIDDGFIIDGEPIPDKAKRKPLGTKQKALVLAACIVAGIWFTKHQGAAPSPADVAKSEQVHIDPQVPKTQGSDIPSPAFNLGNPTPSADKNASQTTAVDKGRLGFGDSTAKTKDDANGPITADVLTADLNEQFSSTPDDGNEVLDPFTGTVKTVQTQPADLPVTPKPKNEGTPSTAPSSPAPKEIALGTTSPTSSEGSPFSKGNSNSAGLSGTKNQNPDSKASVLQDQSANADVTALKAKSAEKDSRIGTLETEVSKLKADLATTKQELAQAQKGPGTTSPSKRNQIKPAQSSTSTQRPTPSQRVASVPRSTPRPQICVTAVAQAARNCTTCVPHAFITHQGSETMVGQGDFLDGLRVNIVGDRLDLQNAQGDVVHKFWSSPNGCSAS